MTEHETLMHEQKIKSKYEDGKFDFPINKIGTTCSVCHKVPLHSRTYYGRLFCIECFHKYIWTPTKSGALCSGDLKVSMNDQSSCDMFEASGSK